MVLVQYKTAVASHNLLHRKPSNKSSATTTKEISSFFIKFQVYTTFLSQNNNITMSIIPSFFSNANPFAMEVWDPFREFSFFSSSSLISSFPELSNETSALVNTRIDWKETPESHVFKADLPGLKKEEVKVEVEGDRVLQIRGERSKEHEENNDKWHRVERSSGKFLRRFRLPENPKMDQVKASMENGVLTVTVPKAEVKKPEVKAVEISC